MRPVQRHCPICQAVTWHYDGLCKFAYLHAPPSAEESTAAQVLAALFAALTELKAGEALAVVGALAQRLLEGLPPEATELWIATLRDNLRRH